MPLRLLAKEMKSVDRQPTLIGRYNQILFDGPPSMMPLLTQ
jgi:ribosomal protein S6